MERQGDIVVYRSSDVTLNRVGDETFLNPPRFTCNGNGTIQSNDPADNPIDNTDGLAFGDRVTDTDIDGDEATDTDRGIITNREITEGNFEVVISGAERPNRTDQTPISIFDPSLGTNRTYRGILNDTTQQSGVTVSGNTIRVQWDGRDNDGNFFNPGLNYPIQVRVRGGEYYFPFFDVEHNPNGGPLLTLVSPSTATYPTEFIHGANTGFYDDRIYKDSAGTFGDKKGLDLWTFVPSQRQVEFLDIIGSPAASNPNLVLAKRITGVNVEARSLTLPAINQRGF